ILEELHDLGELLFGLLHARDVRESDRRLVPGDHSRARTAERDRLVVAALRLAQHPPHGGGDQDDPDDVGDQHAEQVVGAVGRLDLDVDGPAVGGLVRCQGVYKRAARAARAVGQGDVVLAAVDAGGHAVGAFDVDFLDVAGGSLVDEVRVRPVARALVALERLPREPDHQAEYDDQCEIKQAGAGKAGQLGTPGRLLSDSTLAGIPLTVTCNAGSPARLASSADTAIPGTIASESPANTSGQASLSSRGTRASTKMSWSFRVPRPISGRIVSPGVR